MSGSTKKNLRGTGERKRNPPNRAGQRRKEGRSPSSFTTRKRSTSIRGRRDQDRQHRNREKGPHRVWGKKRQRPLLGRSRQTKKKKKGRGLCKRYNRAYGPQHKKEKEGIFAPLARKKCGSYHGQAASTRSARKRKGERIPPKQKKKIDGGARNARHTLSTDRIREIKKKGGSVLTNNPKRLRGGRGGRTGAREKKLLARSSRKRRQRKSHSEHGRGEEKRKKKKGEGEACARKKNEDRRGFSAACIEVGGGRKI